MEQIKSRWFHCTKHVALFCVLPILAITPEGTEYARMLQHLSGVEVELRPVVGGLSNQNYHVTSRGLGYIMRVPGDASLIKTHRYSRIHLINRSMEELCAKSSFEAGLSPELVEYQQESGVMLTRWLDGTVLTDITFKARLAEFGKLLRNFHDTVRLGLVDSGMRTFSALARAENYLALAEELHVTVPPKVREAFIMARQIDVSLRAHADRVVALHGDLIPGNLIDSDRLWLFDFEYCHFGDPMWDLANVVALNRLSVVEKNIVIKAYGVTPDEFVSSKLELMMWLIGLTEGMWGLVQHQISAIPFIASWTDGVKSFHEYGMRFLDAAVVRLKEWEFLGHILRLKQPESKSAEL